MNNEYQELKTAIQNINSTISTKVYISYSPYFCPNQIINLTYASFAHISPVPSPLPSVMEHLRREVG